MITPQVEQWSQMQFVTFFVVVVVVRDAAVSHKCLI